MATVTFIRESKQSLSAMHGVIVYCSQEKKIADENGRRYLSGVNCSGANAEQEFRLTKQAYHKTHGMNYYHYVQSFSPQEPITYAQAHEIAREFAAGAWPGHEVLVATHCDAAHIHSHFVINSVSFETGYKLRQHPDTLKHLRNLSDEICVAHGFPSIYSDRALERNVTRKMSAREYRSAMKMESWKQKLAIQIEDAMQAAASREEFQSLMESEGYGITWTPGRKYITYTCPNGMKCRDNKLHESKFTKEMMNLEFGIRAALTRSIESTGEAGAARSRKRRPLRGCDGAELEGLADLGEAARRAADGAASAEQFTGDVGRFERRDGLADAGTEPKPGRNGGADGGVSGKAGGTGGSIYERGADGRLGFVETGWERERAALLRSLRGEREAAAIRPETVRDFSDPGGAHAALGAGMGALAAIGSLFDDDSEDEEERRRRREAEQNGADLGALIGLGIDAIALFTKLCSPPQTAEPSEAQTAENSDPAQTLGGI